jgi:uncharacterized protein (TIGR00251 family)
VISDHPDGFLVELWVVPGAARSEVVGEHAGALKVRVAAPPEGGRANAEVCRLLRGYFAARSVEITRGTASRRKQALVVGGSRAPDRE